MLKVQIIPCPIQAFRLSPFQKSLIHCRINQYLFSRYRQSPVPAHETYDCGKVSACAVTGYYIVFPVSSPFLSMLSGPHKPVKALLYGYREFGFRRKIVFDTHYHCLSIFRQIAVNIVKAVQIPDCKSASVIVHQ